MAIVLPRAIVGAIHEHGRETYPHECCGALIGRGGVAMQTLPLPNTTEEGPRRRFLVRPGDYRAAEERASEAGQELLGFYHSHPDHPARPSQYDLDHVVDGAPADLRSWRLREDRSQFDEETIDVHQDSNSNAASPLHR
jgi:proteasome lid subunit RPN8/RPN11